MGKAKFWPPRSPKPLNGFRWNLGYITRSRVCPHMQIHVALRQRGWSGRTREKTRCGFLGILFKFFCFILRLALSPHKWTDFDDQYVMDVPFGSLIHTAPHFGGTIPKRRYLGAWISIFKLIAQTIKICIPSKLLRRLPNFAQSQRPPNTLRGWSQHA